MSNQCILYVYTMNLVGTYADRANSYRATSCTGWPPGRAVTTFMVMIYDTAKADQAEKVC